MSRRTTPVFNSSSRHSHGHPIRPLPTLSSPAPTYPPPTTASERLLLALCHPNFAEARRAVSSNPQILFSDLPTDEPTLPPLDYALHQASAFHALHAHCQRTVTPALVQGALSLRESIFASDLIISYLLSQPGPPPTQSRLPLHIAVSCGLRSTFTALLHLYPHLARSTDPRGKTPLHACCALSDGVAPSLVAAFVTALVKAGADVNAKDAAGLTPLHQLVYSLARAAPPNALGRRRRAVPSLTAVQPVMDQLLIGGANIYQPDAHGRSPVVLAVMTGVDYVVFALRADWVFQNVCESPMAVRYACGWSKGRVGGVWGLLPDEVVARIFSLLSPKDVVEGVGATCHGLRRIAVSRDLWTAYTSDHCMDTVRKFLQNRWELPTANAEDAAT